MAKFHIPALIDSEAMIAEVLDAVGKDFDRKSAIKALDDSNDWDVDEAVNLIINGKHERIVDICSTLVSY